MDMFYSVHNKMSRKTAAPRYFYTKDPLIGVRLSYDGYKFVRLLETKFGVQWICINRITTKCHAKLEVGHDSHLYIFSENHNHELPKSKSTRQSENYMIEVQFVDQPTMPSDDNIPTCDPLLRSLIIANINETKLLRQAILKLSERREPAPPQNTVPVAHCVAIPNEQTLIETQREIAPEIPASDIPCGPPLEAPCNSVEDLVAFEEKIRNNVQSFSALKNVFYQTPGSQLKTYVFDCMQYCITDSLAMKCSIIGSINKLQVREFILISLIIECALGKFQEATSGEIIKLMAKWFHYAVHRDRLRFKNPKNGKSELLRQKIKKLKHQRETFSKNKETYVPCVEPSYEIQQLENQQIDTLTQRPEEFKAGVQILEIPCNKRSALIAFETKIQEDMPSFSAFENLLDKIPASTLPRFIADCLKSCITDTLAVKCSIYGTNNKLALRDYTLITAIADCAQKKFPVASSIEISETIRKWFQYANHRGRRFSCSSPTNRNLKSQKSSINRTTILRQKILKIKYKRENAVGKSYEAHELDSQEENVNGNTITVAPGKSADETQQDIKVPVEIAANSSAAVASGGKILKIPCNKIDGLLAFEAKIKEDMISFSAFENILDKIPFSNLRKYIMDCLTSCITDPLAAKVSLYGRNSKLSVRDFTFISLIIDFSQKKCPQARSDEILDIISKWFRYANNRNRRASCPSISRNPKFQMQTIKNQKLLRQKIQKIQLKYKRETVPENTVTLKSSDDTSLVENTPRNTSTVMSGASSQEIQQLESQDQINPDNNQTAEALCDNILDIPCNKLKSLVAFEARIKKDMLSFSAFGNLLENIAPTTLPIYIMDCLKSCITDPLARKCSMDGKKGKLSLREFTLINVIAECALKKFPDASSFEILKVMAKWFHYANHRGSRKSRIIKSQKPRKPIINSTTIIRQKIQKRKYVRKPVPENIDTLTPSFEISQGFQQLDANQGEHTLENAETIMSGNISQEIQQVGSLEEQINSENPIADATCDKILDIPCNKLDSLLAFEARIKEDMLSFSAFGNLLENISSLTLQKYIMDCLKSCITDSLACRCSMDGKNNKFALRDYTVVNLIAECALKKFPDASSDEIIKTMNKWFQYANHRGRRKWSSVMNYRKLKSQKPNMNTMTFMRQKIQKRKYKRKIVPENTNTLTPSFETSHGLQQLDANQEKQSSENATSTVIQKRKYTRKIVPENTNSSTETCHEFQQRDVSQEARENTSTVTQKVQKRKYTRKIVDVTANIELPSVEISQGMQQLDVSQEAPENTSAVIPKVKKRKYIRKSVPKNTNTTTTPSIEMSHRFQHLNASQEYASENSMSADMSGNISYEIKQLGNHEHNSDPVVDASGVENLAIPCDKLGDLLALEAKIKEDMPSYLAFEHLLDKITFRTLQRYIINCLKCCITERLALKCSLEGKKNNKLKMQDFTIIHVIAACAQKKSPGATSIEIIQIIKKWFQYAKNRQPRSRISTDEEQKPQEQNTEEQKTEELKTEELKPEEKKVEEQITEETSFE